MTENEIRDYIFKNYATNLHSLILDKKLKFQKKRNKIVNLSTIIKNKVETKIKYLINELENLEIDKKEVSLCKTGEATIRADLIGHLIDGRYCTVIIELKKSNQTARQAFTELLAYNNYFCSRFPPLNQKQIFSILISPIKRTIKDAYIQELLFNDNSILLLEPEDETFEKSQKLKVIYPTSNDYKYFSNKLLNDDQFSTLTISFFNIDGFIDTNEKENNQPNDYTVKNMDTITQTIALELEKNGLHGIVYATQSWKEIYESGLIIYPNTINVCVLNPFNFSYLINENKDEDIIDWTTNINFDSHFCKVVLDIFDFLTNKTRYEGYEISFPNFKGLKENPIESSYIHTHHGYATGLIRDIYVEHIKLSKNIKFDYANETDDIDAIPFTIMNEPWLIINTIFALSQEGQLLNPYVNPHIFEED